MPRVLITVLVVLMAFVGCVEFQQLLIPDSDPDARWDFDFDNDNGAPNDNDGGNDNDNANQNDNDNANDNDNTNDNDNDNSDDAVELTDELVERVNAGKVGDIPPLDEAFPDVPVEPGEEVITDSGLRYFDVGTVLGSTPDPDDTVTVSYTGWLASDGTEFDSNDSAQFPLQGVIEGWQEGLATMGLGSSRRLFIPPELGYGEAGNPPSIPPDAVLVFDVRLLGISD